MIGLCLRCKTCIIIQCIICRIKQIELKSHFDRRILSCSALKKLSSQNGINASKNTFSYQHYFTTNQFVTRLEICRFLNWNSISKLGQKKSRGAFLNPFPVHFGYKDSYVRLEHSAICGQFLTGKFKVIGITKSGIPVFQTFNGVTIGCVIVSTLEEKFQLKFYQQNSFYVKVGRPKMR